ncbi:G patch domain-containing protein 4-like isoform X2 [Mizuhopecten yessoensis]|uniref:G patch domain-containing protein 4-like isoform X2 n=1 Tax=Mizuhopecten yessoensis TaxID=6573 RepID=UPI000B45F852|nr:G patch domain-containing protein 4-like isoform X2 [Mizuhopecten yessoensis]
MLYGKFLKVCQSNKAMLYGKFLKVCQSNKAMLYGKFLKGATLSGGNYEATNEGDSDDEEEHQEDTKPARIQDLDDAVLLKACGGMTGHKAARHGHKLNGKLARIQEQEALLLAKYKSQKTVIKDQNKVTEQGNPLVKQNEKGDDILQTDDTADIKEKRKEKKKDKSERKKRKREMEESQCNKEEDTIDTDNIGIPTKHRCEESSESEGQDTYTTKKKRKEKKRKNKEKSENVPEDIVCDEESNRKKKKNKKRKSEVLTTDSVSSVTDSKKKKRKDKLKTHPCDDSETSLSKHSDECAVQDSGATKKKKSKKQKKEKSCD